MHRGGINPEKWTGTGVSSLTKHESLLVSWICFFGKDICNSVSTGFGVTDSWWGSAKLPCRAMRDLAFAMSTLVVATVATRKSARNWKWKHRSQSKGVVARGCICIPADFRISRWCFGISKDSKVWEGPPFHSEVLWRIYILELVICLRLLEGAECFQSPVLDSAESSPVALLWILRVGKLPSGRGLMTSCASFVPRRDHTFDHGC